MTTKISLNSDILQKCNIASGFVDKAKKDYFVECVQLHQKDDNLVYMATDSRMIFQAVEKIDYTLPHPMFVNIRNFSKTKKTGPRVDLEIPKCTMENLNAFNSVRPAWIRGEDLKTKIAQLNNKRTNLEYIEPLSPAKFFNAPKSEMTFEQLDLGYTKIDGFHGSAKTEDFDFYRVAKIVSGSGIFQLSACTPNRIAEYLQETPKASCDIDDPDPFNRFTHYLVIWEREWLNYNMRLVLDAKVVQL